MKNKLLLCTFQDPNVPVASDARDELVEHVQPETAELTESRRTTIKRRSNTKLKGQSKKKPGPKPKKVVPKAKLKEKKVLDKKQLKEKRKQVCPICGMLVSFLPYHLEVHDPNIFYDCDICGHRAPSRTVIINHFRNKHFSKRFGIIDFYFKENIIF